MKQRAETDVIARLRVGDEAEFRRIVTTHHRALLHIALAYVGSAAVAEEVVQETWLGVLDGIHAFAGRSTLRTWIFRIAQNRAKTRGARERRSVPFVVDDDGEPAVAPERFLANGHWSSPPQAFAASPETLVAQHRAVQQLEQAIAALPLQQRIVVTLRDVEGVDADETCQLLNVTEAHQRVLLHRARSTLRAVLEAHLEGKSC